MDEPGEPDPVSVAADHVSRSVRESIEAARSSFAAARDGTYDVERLSKDIGDAWVRAVRFNARLLTDTMRVAEHLAQQRPPPGEDGEHRAS